MSSANVGTKYDEVLSSILVNEKSILGFLSAIFNFLARRTDFYYVPEGPYENIGFPPGVAEQLVIKVLRTCDPKTGNAPNGAKKHVDLNNEIMCSTVAQEVEVIAEGDEIYDYDEEPSTTAEPIDAKNLAEANNTKDNNESEAGHVISIEGKSNDSQKLNETPKEPVKVIPDDYKPPLLPTQKNSETYNGAETDKYCWAQTIMDLDVTVKLPPEIKSAKDLKVIINAGEISVAQRNGDIIIKDSLPYKIKALDSFWSISEGKLLMHLEKSQERWWNKFLNGEEPIDLDRIDCSRPLDELPQDHIDKVRELQWNQEQKLKGLPTSDEIRNIQILKKAWNAPGSPFQGSEFDPSVLKHTLPNIPDM